MVAKPLCPLYKNIIKPLDRARYPELRYTIADDAKVIKGSTNWHLGYGADLQVGYQLTSCLKLGIYSGLTRLTGERMDGMPEHLHKNNFVWESGVRLGINLSKKKNKIAETPSVPQMEVLQLNQFHILVLFLLYPIYL